ncbi:phosphoesterase, partial [Conexibacter sp. JD483]|nr:phosphoesterase [Conexibacter sp. JD483]
SASAAAAAPAAVTPLVAARRRRAAVPAALAALVGLFVVSGTSVSALAGSSQPPFTVVLPAQVAQQIAQAPPAAAPPVADAPIDDTPVDDSVYDDTPVEETPAADTPADNGDEAPTTNPGDMPADDGSPVKHVFMIVLGSTDVAALAQDETAAPYVAGTLAKSGTLLSDYTTVAGGSLANRIALVSGQGPTRQTLADCTTYGDVAPADALDGGQTGGDGCVYGFETGHVGDQLRALERTWKAYTEPAAGSARARTAASAAGDRAAAGPRAR